MHVLLNDDGTANRMYETPAGSPRFHAQAWLIQQKQLVKTDPDRMTSPK